METQLDSIENHEGEKFHPEKPRIPGKIQKRISFSNIVETEEDKCLPETEEELNHLNLPEFISSETSLTSRFLDDSKPHVETFLSEMRKFLNAQLNSPEQTDGRESIPMKDVKRKFCQIHAKRTMMSQTIRARVESCRKRREVIEQDGYTELNNFRDSIESLRESVSRIPGVHHYMENLEDTFKEIFFTLGILHSCIGKIAQENELYGSTKEEERVYEEMMVILDQIEEMRSKAKQERSNLKDIKADLYKMFKSGTSSSSELSEEKSKANDKQRYRRSRSLAQLFPQALKPLIRDTNNNSNQDNSTEHQAIPTESFPPTEVNTSSEYESSDPYFNERRGSKPWIEEKVKPVVSFARSMILGPISTISMGERRTSWSSSSPPLNNKSQPDKLNQDTIVIPRSYLTITCIIFIILIFTNILSFVKYIP